MLGAHGLRAEKDLYRATSAVKRGLGFFSVLLDEPPHSVASYDTQREMETLF
jgi:hypothetical protein